jgi:predicted Zn-dependent protease
MSAMIPLSDLEKATREGLAYLKAQEDVEEGEVFVSANGVLLARLNYTSHIPCNGVEEPKSIVNYGVGVQAVLKSDGESRRIGFGSETSDISVAGVQSALEKARKGAVADPEFKSLARPTGEQRKLKSYHDPKVLEIEDANLVDAGWRVVHGALKVFETSESLSNIAEEAERLNELGLIVSGDVTILQERMAIASYNMPDVQTDESSLIMSFITSMVEREGSKGSGYAATTTLDGFTDEAGREAAEAAINTIGGARLPSGDYRVVFGRQATMEIMHYIVLPGLNTGMFYAAGSPFMGQMGQQVASEKFSLFDDGAAEGLVGSKGITCEGLPTGRTELIREGRLVGLLSNHYETQRLLADPKAKEKLGVDPSSQPQAFVPRNGFRFARGGGRHFDAQPGINPTNVIMPGEIDSTDEMCRLVGDGIYVGRIWYTYPVNGLRAGDFTGTVVGDSYVIRDGKLAEPVKPNTLRINENIRTVLSGIVGVAKRGKPTLVWAADEIVYAPEVAVEKVRLDAIGEYMETL